jgi:hypothetical protein
MDWSLSEQDDNLTVTDASPITYIVVRGLNPLISEGAISDTDPQLQVVYEVHSSQSGYILHYI